MGRSFIWLILISSAPNGGMAHVGGKVNGLELDVKEDVKPDNELDHLASAIIGAVEPEFKEKEVHLAAESTTDKPDEIDEKEKPIFGGWIYVGEMDIGCKNGPIPSTPVTVLFDTGSSVLVLKTQKTFDVVAKQACEEINEMFVDVTGCDGGKCGRCYMHTQCFQPQDKHFTITYGSGPVSVSMGEETVHIAGQEIPAVSIGEVTNFHVRTFFRKDFQGIAGLMHNANGHRDGKSLFQYLREKGMESFGYCINKAGESQVHWFDDRRLADGAKRVDVVCQHHWGVTMEAIYVGGTEVRPDPPKKKKDDELADDDDDEEEGGVPLGKELCGDAPCVGILDTGTNFVVGPSPVMEKLTRMIQARGFREDCGHQTSLLPTVKFVLGGEHFNLRPEHYIVQQRVKTRLGVEVNVCALLFGPMDGMMQKDEDGEESSAENMASKPRKDSSMSNVFILGTPFMRGNYIRFVHPQGEDPFVMIHEKCPEDFNKQEKRRMNKNMEKHYVEISPTGGIIDHVGDSEASPNVVRDHGDGTGKIQHLMQLPGRNWVVKDWMAAMDGGRECTPGKKMNFNVTRDQPIRAGTLRPAYSGVVLLAALLAAVAAM